MTPRIDNEARIDVLAVLGSATDFIETGCGGPWLSDMRESRAAVAELIEAARESASFAFTRDIDANTWMGLPREVADAVARLCLVRDRLSAALARCGVTR